MIEINKKYIEPQEWVIVRIKERNNEPKYKVFATWRESIENPSNWRLSTDIDRFSEDDDFYYFGGCMGSIYKCSKKSTHYTTGSDYTTHVLYEMINVSAPAKNTDVEILEYNTDFKQLFANKKII